MTNKYRGRGCARGKSISEWCLWKWENNAWNNFIDEKNQNDLSFSSEKNTIGDQTQIFCIQIVEDNYGLLYAIT